MSPGEIIYSIGLLITLIVIYLMVLVITMNRNIKKVVQIFEEKNALSAKTAISYTDLNIQKQGIIERAIKKRDNRIHALKFLLDGGVVIITGDERYYLNKKKMTEFKKRLNFIGRMMVPDIDN
ncbi:MAG TPA: hypothetical protein PKH42_07510 [Sedimentibacter sp.]|jgi:hypothetical protein|nr:hypothetical protein [Sedimentibacter sp.]